MKALSEDGETDARGCMPLFIAYTERVMTHATAVYPVIYSEL